LFAASGAAGRHVTILLYGCGRVGITPEMVFGFAGLFALRLAGCRSVLVELPLALKLIFVPTLCPHPFSRRCHCCCLRPDSKAPLDIALRRFKDDVGLYSVDGQCLT
jgi:hypothetical protein